MLLENKNARVCWGAERSAGSVARVFARAVAKDFLAGRTLAKLDVVAKDVSAASLAPRMHDEMVGHGERGGETLLSLLAVPR